MSAGIPLGEALDRVLVWRAGRYLYRNLISHLKWLWRYLYRASRRAHNAGRTGPGQLRDNSRHPGGCRLHDNVNWRNFDTVTV